MLILFFISDHLAKDESQGREEKVEKQDKGPSQWMIVTNHFIHCRYTYLVLTYHNDKVNIKNRINIKMVFFYVIGHIKVTIIIA